MAARRSSWLTVGSKTILFGRQQPPFLDLDIDNDQFILYGKLTS
jgi:hypothetical protein